MRRTIKLSKREMQVVELLLLEIGQKEIAGRLNLSHKTVAAYWATAKSKLNITGLVSLTKWAIRNGITSAEEIDRVDENVNSLNQKGQTSFEFV